MVEESGASGGSGYRGWNIRQLLTAVISEWSLLPLIPDFSRQVVILKQQIVARAVFDPRVRVKG